MDTKGSLINQLEATLASGSDQRRLDMLKQVTELFVAQCSTINSSHVAVFDEVMLKLVEGIETHARAELAKSMAPIANAPAALVIKLARDESIEVAGPVLRHSDLDDQTLVHCSSTLGQGHLLAISQRLTLAPTVTDVLVARGDRDVRRTVAGNGGARFSETGLDLLVRHSKDDAVLAEAIAVRQDLPDAVFRRLVRNASVIVRARLAELHPDRAPLIDAILNDIAQRVAVRRDYAAAEELVAHLRRKGALTEPTLVEFIQAGHIDEAVAVLAALSGTTCGTVDEAMTSEAYDPILILAKAASLSWPTVRQLLTLRVADRGGIASQTLELCRHSYLNLTARTAQRVVRFYKARRAIAGEQSPSLVA